MRNWSLKNDKTNLNTHYRAKHSSCWINMWLTLSCKQCLHSLKICRECSHCRCTNKPKPTFMPSEFPGMSYISVLFHPFIQLFIFLLGNENEQVTMLIPMSVGPQVLWLHRYIPAAPANTVIGTIGAPRVVWQWVLSLRYTGILSVTWVLEQDLHYSSNLSPSGLPKARLYP